MNGTESESQKYAFVLYTNTVSYSSSVQSDFYIEIFLSDIKSGSSNGYK